MYLAKIYVNYKQSILNPEAQAIKGAIINRLGYDEVNDLKLGKYFELTIDGVKNKDEAAKKTDEICDQLLANLNMETYKYEIEELEAAK